MTSPLLMPLRFRNGKTASNRLWLAPMTNKASNPDGTLSDDEERFLAARAAGGFGVIETCASHVSIDGQAWEGELGMFSDDLVPGWQRLAAAMGHHEALLIGQAFHGGARALRSPDRRLRTASWIVAIVLLGSGFLLTQGAVERRAQAGAEVRALIAALAKTADAVPASSYAFVIVPDHLGSIPFARNAQGGLMLPPVQSRSLSPQLVVQLADDLPAWPAQLEKNIIARLKAEPLSDVAADRGAAATQLPPAVPDRYFCWSPRGHALVELPLSFREGFSDWNEVWGRALDAAGCRA